jgi:hypothetical protein
VDTRLREETQLYAYRFACEDCAHATRVPTTPIDADREIRCSLGYPAEPRRHALEDSELTLCKAFELQ